MTQDEIADLYQKANGWSPRAYPNTMTELEAFTKLVEDAAFKRWAAQTKLAVQDEREACAKVCDDVGMFHEVSQGSDLCFALSNEIRARGDA